MRNRTYPIALGGMLAAASVVIMSIGTIVPVATYAAPVVCMMVGQVVLKLCGSRIAWAWYAAVTILSVLLAPDKEAAAVFAVLGYYPIVKPKLDGKKAKWLWKTLLYWAALELLGIRQLEAEFAELGRAMTAVLLVLGNVTFFALDRVLEKGLRIVKKK